MNKPKQKNFHTKTGPNIPEFTEILKKSKTAQAWLDYVTTEIRYEHLSDEHKLRHGLSNIISDIHSTGSLSRSEIVEELNNAEFKIESSLGILEITGQNIYSPTFTFKTWEEFEKLAKTFTRVDKINPLGGTQIFVPARDTLKLGELPVPKVQFPLGVIFRVKEKGISNEELSEEQIQLHEQIHAIDLLGMSRLNVENGDLLSELIAYLGEHIAIPHDEGFRVLFNHPENWINLIDTPLAEDLTAVTKNRKRISEKLIKEGKYAAVEEIMRSFESLINLLLKKYSVAELTRTMLSCRTFSDLFQRLKIISPYHQKDELSLMKTEIQNQVGDIVNISDL